MENKRFVIYCPRTASRNFSFWDNPFWDAVEATHYASGIEAKTGLKTLVSPVVDRIYKNIVGKKNVHRFLDDKYYNANARQQINQSHENMKDLLEDADYARELANIPSIGEITSIGGIENAIAEANKAGNTGLVKKLEKIKQDYREEEDTIEKIKALQEDHNKGRRVSQAHDSKFQKFRNSLGDRFLNKFGMNKNWDPSMESSWKDNFYDYLGSKYMRKYLPESWVNVYNTGNSVASMLYKFSPELGNKVSQLVTQAKKSVDKEVEKRVDNSNSLLALGGRWILSGLSAASTKRHAPRFLNRDPSYAAINRLGLDLAAMNSQEAANLAKLRGRTP